MIDSEVIQKLVNGTQAERMYICEKEFKYFLVYYFTEYLKYPFAPFHYEMFQDLRDLMSGKYREVAWIMFRESAKTSISKIFIIWLICFQKRKYLNVDSYSLVNAERILFDVVSELQTNNKIKQDFGELYNSKRDADEVTQKRVNNFVTNNKIRVEAHSTSKPVRGRIHKAQRPDFLLLDDFENNETKDSKALTQGVIDHITEFQSGLDGNAWIIYLGNLITESGSIQHIIDRAKTDHKLQIRSVPVEAGGMPTWPQKYAMSDSEALLEHKISLEDKKRQLGPIVYSAEMLNQPLAKESQKFHREKFKYKSWSDVESLFTRRFATIDSALSKSEDDDATGVIRNYVDLQGHWYIKSQALRVDPKGVIDVIFQLHSEGFEKIGIETTAFTQAIEPFLKEECDRRRIYPYIVQLKHGGVMKESRIEALVPYYERGLIYHIEGECSSLEEELLRFPVGRRDDQIDSLQYQRFIVEAPIVRQMRDTGNLRPMT